VLQVATNGVSVTNISVESGNPFLAREATENLRSWRFAKNEPRSFEVTYTYELKNEQVVFLEKPGAVTVDVESAAPQVNGIFSTFETPPEIWQMDLKNSRGGIHTRLSLVDADDLPDGYVMNEAPGTPGKQREVIRNGHQDGDILGFDATVKGPDGKPLKVSVLGRKTGNKITGIFLDYSGLPGTWIAVRQSSRAKSPK
jgi:hypothetical protein